MPRAGPLLKPKAEMGPEGIQAQAPRELVPGPRKRPRMLPKTREKRTQCPEAQLYRLLRRQDEGSSGEEGRTRKFIAFLPVSVFLGKGFSSYTSYSLRFDPREPLRADLVGFLHPKSPNPKLGTP